MSVRLALKMTSNKSSNTRSNKNAPFATALHKVTVATLEVTVAKGSSNGTENERESNVEVGKKSSECTTNKATQTCLSLQCTTRPLNTLY